MNAYIDDSYIPDPRQKIEMYKKMARVEGDQDAREIEEELTDRFGDMPQAVMNLVNVSRLKALCKRLGIVAISQLKGDTLVKFGPLSSLTTEQIYLAVKAMDGNANMVPSRQPTVKLRTAGRPESSQLKLVLDLMNRLATHVS